ncbi:MAG: hypothetical protein ACP5N1_03410 [Candidatus Woesearchaeota archaeon]
MSEDLKNCLEKLEEISKKLSPYEGQLILVDRTKDFDYTFCDEECTPFMSPIPRTIEVGTLIQPLMLYKKDLLKKTYVQNIKNLEEEITDYSLTGIIFLSDKIRAGIWLKAIMPNQLQNTLFDDNSNIYLEDLLQQTYKANRDGMLARVTDFEIIYGNDKVKKHLRELTENYVPIDEKLKLDIEKILEIK